MAAQNQSVPAQIAASIETLKGEIGIRAQADWHADLRGKFKLAEFVGIKDNGYTHEGTKYFYNDLFTSGSNVLSLTEAMVKFRKDMDSSISTINTNITNASSNQSTDLTDLISRLQN
jgi:hypothetical protein